MTDWDRIERRLGTEGLQRLRNLSVAIVGCGSLGSMTALLLAMSGVKNFILFDPDELSDSNIVRHAADDRYLGQPKVEVVKDLILHRNQDAVVKAVQDSAFNHEEELEKAHLVIVAGLGSEIAQQQMGRLMRELKKPALYGGAYTRAKAGEVIFVDPENGPCYACFATLLRETQTTEEHKVDYGMPPDEVKAEPGLGIHIFRISIVLSDWALRFLVNDPEVLKPFPGNLVILSNEERVIGEDAKGQPVALPPSSAKWLRIAKQPGCMVCDLKEVQIPDELIEDMLS